MGKINGYTLSNPNADERTRRIFDYICGIFGEKMLAAQQESIWRGTPEYEMDYIERVTGKLPAMRGLDFKSGDFDGVVRRAVDWTGRGGLVTICWHTGVAISDYPECKADDPDFERLFAEGTEENSTLMASWDRAARALGELRDAGVTVLWRPFHEFDGQWFWWGKGGAENFIKLWRLMYDKFTNEYKLNNLIWVLGYSGEVKDGWYPGDEYCDIIGSDTYDNSTNRAGWDRLLKVADKVMAYHECGNVPLFDDFVRDGDVWAWFMPWHTDYLMANDSDTLRAVYNDTRVVTLDGVPEGLVK
ncbi:MAG: glycoside hydrolase family 26 protein [Lachnospiraceae bacterium]|nr:glycoside hydrolase family 26 protein [Ruminococcus sp.]MCM1273750.1 glycoside hydrolase family 26 protein [Lachnospiraceae bacterium]